MDRGALWASLWGSKGNMTERLNNSKKKKKNGPNVNTAVLMRDSQKVTNVKRAIRGRLRER